MLILNIEDDVFKHHNIRKALKSGGFADLHIDCKGNLKDGIEIIEESIKKGKPYDLIITDMWYPEASGGREVKAGEKFIQTARENEWNIPIILCSSVDYDFTGILGSVYYSEHEDWENKLVHLTKRVEVK